MAGLTIVSVQSRRERTDRLAEQGPPVALRFLLWVAVVGIVLAVVSFAMMAAVERRPRGGELAALRRQGLRESVVRRVAFAGYAVLILVAVATGALTAIGLAAFAPSSLPVFGDGWQVLEPAGGPGYVLPATAGAVVVALGVVALLGGTALVAAVRRAR